MGPVRDQDRDQGHRGHQGYWREAARTKGILDNTVLIFAEPAGGGLEASTRALVAIAGNLAKQGQAGLVAGLAGTPGTAALEFAFAEVKQVAESQAPGYIGQRFLPAKA